MEGTPAAYDLHLHTLWSYDATAEIRPYFEQARALGVRCIAIAEHHNLDSADEVAQVARDFPEIRLIVAAELSVHTSIGSVDLLCYNLPRNPDGALAEVLDEYHRWQRASGAAISAAMQELGYDFNEEQRYKALTQFRPARALALQGATHLPIRRLQEAFLRLGYIQCEEEFPELDRRMRARKKPTPYPAVGRVVPVVKAAGGIVVMAHPTIYVQGEDRLRLDALREECALDGIECAHRRVSPELTQFYRRYCLEHGMVSTGGSDCHHPADVVSPERWGHTPERIFASHVGAPEWLDEFLERLA